MNTNSEPKLSRHLSQDEDGFVGEVISVVDVGARYGCDPIWEYAFGENVIQYGFEPDSAEFKRLSEGNAKRNTKNSKYFPVALHTNQSKREFFCASYPAASGFYPVDRGFWNRFQGDVTNFTVKNIMVDTIDLDTFGANNSIGNIDFLKIDVEGAELDVLKGSKRYLDNSILGVLTEVRFGTSSNCPTFADTDQFMRHNGFKLYDLQLNRKTRKSLSHSPQRFAGNTVAWGISKGIGQVISGDALYLRDAVAEMTNRQLGNLAWSDEKILKLACFYELFSLPDCAIELLQCAQQNNYLTDYPIKQFCNLLTPNFDEEEVTYEEYLQNINDEYSNKVIERYSIKWRKIFRLIFYKVIVHNLSPLMYARLRKLKHLFN